MFKFRKASSLSRLIVLAGASMLAGCTNLVDFSYGNTGVPDPYASNQEKNLRQLDIVVMLDPSNQRASIENPSVPNDENEVARALLVFGHELNNKGVDGKSLPPRPTNCSETGQSFDFVDKTLETRVVMKVTRTRVDKLMDKNGVAIRKRGTPVEKIDSVDTVQIAKQPSIQKATLCPLQARMKDRRNAIASQLFGASDAACGRYLRVIRRYNDDINFGATLSAVALGGAGALFEGASAALSAAGGGIASIPAAINESYFNGQALGAVSAAIVTSRSELETSIRAKYEDPPSKWSVNDAIRDLVTYHNLCSVERGVEIVDGTVTPPNIVKVLEAANIIKPQKPPTQ